MLSLSCRPVWLDKIKIYSNIFDINRFYSCYLKYNVCPAIIDKANSTRLRSDGEKACCIPQNPRGGNEAGSYRQRQPAIKIARKVLKGGSHLCAPNYSRRYRPAARQAAVLNRAMASRLR